jgi:hypothetical protein
LEIELDSHDYVVIGMAVLGPGTGRIASRRAKAAKAMAVAHESRIDVRRFGFIGAGGEKE